MGEIENEMCNLSDIPNTNKWIPMRKNKTKKTHQTKTPSIPNVVPNMHGGIFIKNKKNIE